MIEEVSDNLTPSGDHRKIFLHRTEHTEHMAPLVSGSSTFVPVEEKTEGAACTVLLAEDLINNDNPLVIANSDQLVEFDMDKFVDFGIRKGLDGLIMTFKSSHPKWSYAKITSKRRKVVEVAEKNPISHHATVGIYWFRKGSDFVWAAKRMIEQNIRTNGEFYVAPVFNQLIGIGQYISIYRVENMQMHGLGTPEDYERYLAEMGL